MDAPATWPSLISTLIKGKALTSSDTAWAMNEIMDGAATPAQIAGFGVALRMKGETVAEVSGMAEAMLAHATPISLPGPLVDLVGTGGDVAHTVNISTMGAIVAAAAGARVAKHGNRAATSACGAADVLEALGVAIDLPPPASVRLAEEIGIVFLFAPLYHPALRHAGPVRKELGVPTVFNFLGPVANPARPGAQAVGVADPRMGGILAGVLAGRGCSALVFHGHDGLDELTQAGAAPGVPAHRGAGRGAARSPAASSASACRTRSSRSRSSASSRASSTAQACPWPPARCGRTRSAISARSASSSTCRAAAGSPPGSPSRSIAG